MAYAGGLTKAASTASSWRSGRSGASGTAAASGVARAIRVGPGEVQDEALQRASNRVVTAKYNAVTFLPRFLFEMFSRMAYLYFLLQVRVGWGWGGWVREWRDGVAGWGG